MTDANKVMAGGLRYRYPRYVVHWPGIVQVVRNEQDHRKASRAAIVGGLVYLGGLIVGAALLGWQVLTHG